MSEKIHKFELAGLGFAPFRFVGIWEMPSRGFQANYPNQYNRMIASAPCSVGSCHYCGMGISVHYLVKDMNGKVSAVGSECINKAGDAGLMDAARYAKNKRIREKKRAKQLQQHEARLFGERLIYAGLTKGESENWTSAVFMARRKAQVLEERKGVIKILGPMADILQDGQRGFCDSIAETLRKGKLPYGKGRGLMIEILAKKSGRKNSKKYVAAYKDIEVGVVKAEELIEGLPIWAYM